MFDKRDFWEKQFSKSLPMMAAIWWMEDNYEYVDAALMRVDLGHLAYATNGSSACQDIAEYVLRQNPHVIRDILASMRDSESMMERRMYGMFRVVLPSQTTPAHPQDPAHPANGGLWCDALWNEMRQVLAKYVSVSRWLKDVNKDLRQKTRAVKAVKKVLHS